MAINLNTFLFDKHKSSLKELTALNIKLDKDLKFKGKHNNILTYNYKLSDFPKLENINTQIKSEE